MATVTSFAQEGDLMARAIVAEVTQRTAEVLEEEIAGVAERVRQRLRGEVGLIAGRVLEHYEMRRDLQTIVIEVKTDLKGPI